MGKRKRKSTGTKPQHSTAEVEQGLGAERVVDEDAVDIGDDDLVDVEAELLREEQEPPEPDDGSHVADPEDDDGDVEPSEGGEEDQAEDEEGERVALEPPTE